MPIKKINKIFPNNLAVDDYYQWDDFNASATQNYSYGHRIRINVNNIVSMTCYQHTGDNYTTLKLIEPGSLTVLASTSVNSNKATINYNFVNGTSYYFLMTKNANNAIYYRSIATNFSKTYNSIHNSDFSITGRVDSTNEGTTITVLTTITNNAGIERYESTNNSTLVGDKINKNLFSDINKVNKQSLEKIEKQVEYTTPGSYSWTVPAGVTSVCVVCVGGGGGPAANTSGACGAGGGGLGYKNNIAVTAGHVYDVVVGAGGTRATSGTAGSGGNSSFSRAGTTHVSGLGGAGGICGNNGDPAGGSYTGDGGGNGGNGGNRNSSTTGAGGGGGAGGYSGNGGVGGAADATNNGGNGSGGAGGGGGSGGSVDSAGSGGGVGIYGAGTSGNGGAGSSDDGASGYGGSGGKDGIDASASAPGNIYATNYLSAPGDYGGGGCGADNTTNEQAPGAGGAVRIIWGTGRSFPSTRTSDEYEM